jgi:biotin/methionine sulfoxide reductase
MTSYTMAHWGTYEVRHDATGPRLAPLARDADPSPIGPHVLDAGVQRLRVRRPSVRQSWLDHGPGAAPEKRGAEPFVEVPWERALDLVAAELDRVRKAHGNAAIYGGSYGWSSAGRFHHAQSQVHRFLNSIGGYVRHRDSYSLGAGNVILPHVVAQMDTLMASHTSWDSLAVHTKLFVAFGGVPAKNSQMNAGGVGLHGTREGLRRMAAAGTRFVNIGPVRDNLETGGDVEWIPCRPNTDTAVMLGIAHVLATEGLANRAFLAQCCTGYEPFERYLLGRSDGIAKDPHWAERISGVPAARIASLAREMAGTTTMVNVAWALQRASHGEQPFWIVVTLAAMLGQIGTPGGGFGVGYGAANLLGSAHARLSSPTLPQGANAVDAFIPVARVSDMLLNPGATFTYNGATHTYPDIRFIYWAGGNPFHHHQDLNRMKRAWRKPDTIVINEQYWTAAAKFADVVLPATTTLERPDIGAATLEGLLVAMKPAMAPLGEARDDYAIFAALAERLGQGGTYTEGRDTMDWLRHLYDTSRAANAKRGIAMPDFDIFWRDGLVDTTAHDAPRIMLGDFVRDPQAHPLLTPSGKIEIFSERIASFGLADCAGHPAWYAPAEWLGSDLAADYPLHLLSDQPERRLHSQLDASSHSHANKVAGREPLYMNAMDAAARGLNDGDVVEVFNARGRCLAGLRISDAIMPGVARLSTGAWFDQDAPDALEKHGNPNAVTRDAGASGLSQGCTAQTCLVQVKGPVMNPPPVTAHEPPHLV